MTQPLSNELVRQGLTVMLLTAKNVNNRDCSALAQVNQAGLSAVRAHQSAAIPANYLREEHALLNIAALVEEYAVDDGCDPHEFKRSWFASELANRVNSDAVPSSLANLPLSRKKVFKNRRRNVSGETS